MKRSTRRTTMKRWPAGFVVALVLATLAVVSWPVEARRPEPETTVGIAPEQAWAGQGSRTSPGPARVRRIEPGVLIVAARTLPRAIRERVRDLPGILGAADLALASTTAAGQKITIAGVDPATYRRFTPRGTAEADPLWHAVAAGDVALAHELGSELRKRPGSTVTLPARGGRLELRVGAHATTASFVDAVVNKRRADQLGLARDNATLIAASSPDPSRLAARIRKLVPREVKLALVGGAAPASAGAQQPGRTARLTWGPLSRAVGSFRYVARPDGTVQPDPAWVASYIRTESVPILGRITCNRAVFPQLRAALSEVSAAGLGEAVDAGDYGGCYVPRFIGHNPRLGLSLHTWGIALDVNVATNQRGTAGRIDRRVVAIFKKWGFAWGGDWRWTDPMHFELAAVLQDRGPE